MAMYVPDNYDAYARHEAEENAWLASRPICDACGEPIRDEYLYDVNGYIFCEECMENEFKKSTDKYER